MEEKKNTCGGNEIGRDALAYICYLEEQLEEAGKT